MRGENEKLNPGKEGKGRTRERSSRVERERTKPRKEITVKGMRERKGERESEAREADVRIKR